jgi:ribonuclease P protein component
MVGRIVRSADFERVLRTPPRTRGPHFALHHLAASPSRSGPGLSTDVDAAGAAPVDDLPSQVWLGAVVPKRHARRAVTRNLVKRAIREAATASATALPRGLWIVRLRERIDVARYVSAASAPLREAVRLELADLFGRVGRACSA